MSKAVVRKDSEAKDTQPPREKDNRSDEMMSEKIIKTLADGLAQNTKAIIESNEANAKAMREGFAENTKAMREGNKAIIESNEKNTKAIIESNDKNTDKAIASNQKGVNKLVWVAVFVGIVMLIGSYFIARFVG